MRAVAAAILIDCRLVLPREDRGDGETDRCHGCYGAPAMRAQVLGRHLGRIATVLGEPMLQRTEVLFDTCERSPRPFPQSRELFSRQTGGFSKQVACVACEDFYVREQVLQCAPDRLAART
jgi:hypothetical protein